MKNIKTHSERIAATLSKQTFITKTQIEAVIDELVNAISDDVKKGEVVNISGLGQFKKIVRKGRKCRHPISGKPMKWKDTFVVKFHPASRITRIIRGKKA